MAVIKVDDELLARAKKYIKQGENKYDYPTLKAFVDKAVLQYLKNKKGQVSLFLLLSLVILIFGLYLFVTTQTTQPHLEEVVELPNPLQPVQEYVETCIEQVGEEALSFVMDRGGYQYLPTNHEFVTQTPYYIYDGVTTMPSLNTIEEEISNYVDDMLFFCLKNFRPLQEQGFVISQESSSTTVIVIPEKVRFDVDLPLTIQTPEQVYSVEHFSQTLSGVNLYTFYQVSKGIVEDQLPEPSGLCLSCMYERVLAEDLYIELSNLGDSEVYIELEDLNATTHATFGFSITLTNYSCDNLPPDADYRYLQSCLNAEIASTGYVFTVEPISPQTATVGTVFEMVVQAQGLNLEFSDFTDLFDIEPTGEISFLPTQAGEHTIWIRITDSFGDVIYEEFSLEVKNA